MKSGNVSCRIRPRDYTSVTSLSACTCDSCITLALENEAHDVRLMTEVFEDVAVELDLDECEKARSNTTEKLGRDHPCPPVAFGPLSSGFIGTCGRG